MYRKRQRKWSYLWQVCLSAWRARSVHAFYEAIAPVYDEVFQEHRIHIDTIIGLLESRHPKTVGVKILDLACGTGLVSRRLAQQGYTVAGLDFSLRSLELLRQSDHRIPVIQGIAERLPFKKQSFDVIVCLGAWRHFADPARVTQAMSDILTPNGDVIIGYFPPKLGAFFTVPPRPLGQFIVAGYTRLLRRFGYTDRIDAKHLEITMQTLQHHFAQVEVIPSGTHSYLLHASIPITGTSHQ